MALAMSGETLLTQDKGSFRIDRAASLRVSDRIVARTRVARYSGFL